VDPKVQEERERAVNERVRLQYEKAQARLAELVSWITLTKVINVNLSQLQLDTNSTLPCTVSSVRVLNANHTRAGFLERIFNPLLSTNRDRPFTLTEVLRELSIRTNELQKFGWA